MKLIEDALGAVQKAEQLVADLARQAVEQRDYAAAVALTNLASELQDVVLRTKPRSEPPTMISVGVDAGVTAPGVRAEGGHVQSRSSRRKPKKGEFPRFLRDSNTLYKLGWSKTEKAVYEHKASKSDLDALVKKLATIGQNRRRFTIEDVLPLPSPTEDAEVPSYQVYLCLAWLRTTELLVRHGRQGYSLAHPSRFQGDVENNWQRIPLKQDAQS